MRRRNKIISYSRNVKTFQMTEAKKRSSAVGGERLFKYNEQTVRVIDRVMKDQNTVLSK